MICASSDAVLDPPAATPARLPRPAAAARPRGAHAARGTPARRGARGPVAGPFLPYPTPAFGPRGRLSGSRSSGAIRRLTPHRPSMKAAVTFARATRRDREPEKVDANGEAGKIAADAAGVLRVVDAQGHRRPSLATCFARSTDGGRTLSPPVTVNDDGLPTGHRFDALRRGRARRGDAGLGGQARSGGIGGRRVPPTTARPSTTRAATTRAAPSRATSSSRTTRASAAAWRWCARSRGPAGPLLFRDILPGGIRDHSIAVLGGPRPRARRLTTGRINACPHHGPSLAIAAEARTT